MSDELLKDDKYKGTKKTLMTIWVSALAIAMIGAFASFFWLYHDWFRFMANREDALKQLEEVRGQRAAAEAEASQRQDVLSAELDKRSEVMEAYFEKRRQELDDELTRKKEDSLALARDYRLKFDQGTNRLEATIAKLEGEIKRLELERDALADISPQLVTASNALSRAVSQRDAVMQTAREAQDSFNEWNGKIGDAKAQLAEIEGRRKRLEQEIEVQRGKLKTVQDETAKKEENLERLNKKIADKEGELSRTAESVRLAAVELAGVSNKLELASMSLAQANEQIAKAGDDKVFAEKARDAAADARREAESQRDKAIAERELAEKRLKERKPEIEAQLREYEERLEELKRRVAAAETRAADEDEKPEVVE